MVWRKENIMPYKDKEKEKERNRRYQSTWYAKNRDKQLEQVRKAKEAKREWFNSLKLGLKCKQCGQDHPATLDFHHEDPNQKNFNLSCFMNMSKSSILTEIKKCSVLCANCHRILHWNEKTRFNSSAS